MSRIAPALPPIVVATLALAPSSRVSADEPKCDAWDIEYALSANLSLSDTPMGKGDGVHAVGPGSVVLRFENRDGQPAGEVKMLSYNMREHFTIKTKALVFTTTVVTDTTTTATPGACSVVDWGALGANRVVAWRTPANGYRTDGTITCDGTLCGKFGAPPSGKSELHIPPHPVPLSSFTFAPDMKTFTMPSTRVSKTDTPKQTAEIALAGREVRRACVQAPACRK